MKVLVISDLHAEEFLLDKIGLLIEKEKPELTLLLGDLTHNGPLIFAEQVLEMLDERGVKTLGIFGNMDPPQVAKLMAERGVSIHGKVVEYAGFRFAGFGGSAPGAFRSPSVFKEDDFYRVLSKLGLDNETVLLTHTPPKGCGLDKTDSGDEIGSVGLRRVIEEVQPLANFCGHVHEREGETTIGRTKIVKVGAAKNGNATIANLGSRGLSINFVSFF